MWLEDDEIRQCLASNKTDEILQALRAIELRWESGEEIEIEPIRAELLGPFAGQVPNEIIDWYLELLLGVNRVPSLPRSEALAEFAKVIAHYFNTIRGQYRGALQLKIDGNPTEAIRKVVGQLGHEMAQVEQSKVHLMSFFLSCLLDGTAEVRAATVQTLTEWPKTAVGTAVIADILGELTEGERALLGA